MKRKIEFEGQIRVGDSEAVNEANEAKEALDLEAIEDRQAVSDGSDAEDGLFDGHCQRTDPRLWP